jgi:hypothetical protein
VATAGVPLGSDARRSHYSKAGNRKGLVFSPDHVWTFHIWQQFIDLSTYKLVRPPPPLHTRAYRLTGRWCHLAAASRPPRRRAISPWQRCSLPGSC